MKKLSAENENLRSVKDDRFFEGLEPAASSAAKRKASENEGTHRSRVEDRLLELEKENETLKHSMKNVNEYETRITNEERKYSKVKEELNGIRAQVQELEDRKHQDEQKNRDLELELNLKQKEIDLLKNELLTIFKKQHNDDQSKHVPEMRAPLKERDRARIAELEGKLREEQQRNREMAEQVSAYAGKAREGASASEQDAAHLRRKLEQKEAEMGMMKDEMLRIETELRGLQEYEKKMLSDSAEKEKQIKVDLQKASVAIEVLQNSNREID